MAKPATSYVAKSVTPAAINTTQISYSKPVSNTNQTSDQNRTAVERSKTLSNFKAKSPQESPLGTSPPNYPMETPNMSTNAPSLSKPNNPNRTQHSPTLLSNQSPTSRTAATTNNNDNSANKLHAFTNGTNKNFFFL
jgi:hypothetical protein